MLHDDARRRRADRTARLDVGRRAHADDLAADELRELRPADRGERDDEADETEVAEEDDEEDREHQLREPGEGVGGVSHRGVGDAPQPSGGESERVPGERRNDAHRNHGIGDEDCRQQAGQRSAHRRKAERGEFERSSYLDWHYEAWRREENHQVLRLRIVGRDEGTKGRSGRDHADADDPRKERNVTGDVRELASHLSAPSADRRCAARARSGPRRGRRGSRRRGRWRSRGTRSVRRPPG